MLKTTVKISGVTNLSDARYCAGMGVTMLGFGMDATAPDYIDPALAAQIRGWVSGVQIVGETASTDPDHIRQLVESYQPDLLQITAPDLLISLADLDKPLILRLDLTQTTPDQLIALTLPAKLTYLLLDGPEWLPLGPDWLHALLLVCMSQAVLLSAALTPDHLPVLLDTLPLTGIALAGGTENRPGQRDFGRLMDMLEALEIE